MLEQANIENDQRVFQAQLFGAFSITTPGGINATPHGRKSRALAAFLILSGDAPVRRETLATLLWGDRGDEQARASLRQALYELRDLAATQTPLIRIERLHVQLVSDRIETDLGRLRALDVSDDADAVADILGEKPRHLLDDLSSIDGEFDDWLLGERTRRRDERHRIALSVATRALTSGNPEAAYRLSACLLATEPFDEAATTLAMEARTRLGDRDGVRRLFTRYRDALRADLDLGPPAEMVALSESLQAAMAGPERTVTDRRPTILPRVVATDIVPQLPANAGTAALSRWAREHRTLLVVFVGAIALAVGGAVWFEASGQDEQRVIRVLALQAPPEDRRARSLGEGFAADLSRLIVGNDSQLSVIDASDPATADAKAQFVLASDAQSAGDHLHASVRLLDGQSGSILWSRSFSRAGGELEAMRDQVAAAIAAVSVCALNGNSPSLNDLGIDTMRLYLSACEEKYGDWNKASKLLEQIVQRRPDFAHAWALLAMATAAGAEQLPDDATAAPVYRTAANYAHRALALNSKDGTAYAALSFARPEGIPYWLERYDLLAKGYAVDPDNDVINTALAWELMSIGRRREGIVFAQRAVELEPFNRLALYSLINYQGYGGDVSEARQLFDLANQRWPGDPDIAGLAFRTAARNGDPAEALKMLDDTRDPLGFSPGKAAIWRAFLQARQNPGLIAHTIQLLQADAQTAEPDTLVGDAANLAVLGRSDLALATLDRIGDRPVRTNPFFYDYMSRVRANSHFMTIARRQGLVSIWQKTGHWPDFCDDGGLPYDCHHAAALSSP